MAHVVEEEGSALYFALDGLLEGWVHGSIPAVFLFECIGIEASDGGLWSVALDLLGHALGAFHVEESVFIVGQEEDSGQPGAPMLGVEKGALVAEQGLGLGHGAHRVAP